MNLYSHAHASLRNYTVLARLSPCYPIVRGKLHTCYAPVRRSPPKYCYLALPLDLHVLSLSLAFILSQDQTLHCYYYFCFVFLLAPWDDVLFDTYSLSLRISLLICINDGILVYHLFFFRSFYVLHNCSLLFHISLFKAFQRSLRLPRAPPLSLPLAKVPSCRCAFVLSDAPFFGVGTAKVVTYFLLTKFAVRKVPFPRLIHSPLPLSQPALRHAWQNPYF